jgi:uncharacterized protein (TIGR00730 family)
MTSPGRCVCVYCGSSNGVPAIYLDRAAEMGRALASRRLTLVYGGGCTGLMGALADGALDAGGEVVGIITARLNTPELAHTRLTELHVVETMHERKSIMANMADAFVALPGGLGTLEELCEILTWSQLGLHDRPIGLLNVEAFFDTLLALLNHTRLQGFLHHSDRVQLIVEEVPDLLLDRLLDSRPTFSPTRRPG